MKSFVIKICIILFVIFLVGITIPVNKKMSDNEVIFWTLQMSDFSEYMNKVISDFEAENPDIKIDFMHIPQNYFQKLHLLFASNTAPDVVFINNLYLPVYANAGKLEDLTETGLIDENFYKKSVKALSYKNKIYAVPRDISNLVIFYNKDLFDKKGLPYPDENTTFQDFLNLAQKLTDKEKGIFGISFEEEPLFYLPYLMSEGGGILSDDGDENILDTDASRRGIKFYADLRKKYNAAPKQNESASATMAQMFLQQKIAMQISGRWLVPKYRREAQFVWDITNFPGGTKGSVVNIDASGYALSKSSKHKKEALRFIEFISSQQSLSKLTLSGLIVPARKDIAYSDKFLDKKLPPENAIVFLEAIKTGKITPVNEDYNNITDRLNKLLEPVFLGKKNASDL